MDSRPSHIAIIMDGNGRWAKKRGLPRVAGHKKGVETVKDISIYASDIGVKYLSLYAFSMENWLRPGDEVSFLMKLLESYIENELATIMKKDIRLVVSGRIELIPERTRNMILKAVDQASENKGMVLNLALSYGGRAEIVDAAKKVAEDYKNGRISLDELDNEIFSNYIYNPELPDVDLLIRTSGEVRVSNFMLWRIAYAELFFCEKMWPAFDRKDLNSAIEDYSGRVRRFGKTDEQLDDRD